MSTVFVCFFPSFFLIFILIFILFWLAAHLGERYCCAIVSHLKIHLNSLTYTNPQTFNYATLYKNVMYAFFSYHSSPPPPLALAVFALENVVFCLFASRKIQTHMQIPTHAPTKFQRFVAIKYVYISLKAFNAVEP